MTWKNHIPLIAILRGIKPNEIHQHIPLLIEAGFQAIEIPLNSPDWQISIKEAVKHYGKKTLIGAGTVLEEEEVDLLANIGCQLIVTPNINSDVIKSAIKYNMVICPGCATVSEAFSAISAGAKSLKIFPATSFGPNYIKALKTVLPKDIPIFAVGGITLDNLQQYINSGCIGAGLGGELYKAGQSPVKTKQKAQAFIKAYREIQNENN
ncbi:2-dehydro-3-deoxy-6-phosphogalactonate aldolase [Providencia huaxiensis]|uniref:2-dehydro-3-deoxy-6-phosphogalactonate aldolase n=1 Tax=Providencia TaxID=586 RepID=UPI000F7B4A07|nr:MULTISPECIES: 2-dehydro-3-deoxy-6-phosphogalactonate aldolase [Providencia]MBV2189996.1 2-dehydro-3-deoxy-6-phosphogalactonate aldolase [Providencia rettgeri]